MNTILKADKLAFAYDGITVARNISFALHEGELLCIVGENGSGKSTLTKGLLGLIRPADGRVEFPHGRGGVGYLPQQTEVQKDFPATVREIVLSGTLPENGSPFYKKSSRTAAEENLRLLGIDKLADTCYRELSGGQQQRTLLARALCAAKRLLVLDEPTTGLDPVATAELYSLIKHLNREHGLTVIAVTHDPAAVLECATHILHLRHEPVFCGTREEYLNSDIGIGFFGGNTK